MVAFVCPFAWSQTPEVSLGDQVRGLNRRLSTANPRGPETRDILTERASLLRELVAKDPAQALQLQLPETLGQQLRANHSADLFEEQGEWTGSVEPLTEDDFEHRQSRGHNWLHSNGQQMELFFSGQQKLPRSKQVRVTGLRVDDRIAVAALSVVDSTGAALQSESVAPAQTETVAAALTSADCDTFGDQKTVVIMVTTPANPVFPFGFDATYFTQRYFTGNGPSLSTSSVNSFMQEVSYSQASLSGTVVGPFALTQNYTCDEYSSLRSAALAAADPSIDFTIYRRIVIIFPISTCSYGGLGTIGCIPRTTSDGSNASSVSWIPILPAQSTQRILPIIAHEFGHNLGLGHANTDDYGNITLGHLGTTGTTREYNDPFSTMGLSRSFSGQPIGGQFAAPQKVMMLGWIGSFGYQEVLSNGTFNLAPLENAAGLRALRVLRDPATSSWLWLEYRQPIGLADSSLSLLSNTGPSTVYQGVLIHSEAPVYLNTSSGVPENISTYLLDATPVGEPNEFYDAALLPGSTFIDSDSLLRITVNSANSSGVSVTVTYDPPCATLQTSATEFDALLGSGTITVSAPSDCAWTASSAFSWLILTGATSGQGNGIVSFSVANQTDPTERTGFITVQRQSIRITQAGAALSVLSVTPSSGNGSGGQVVFRLRHASGNQAITAADLYFENVYFPNRPSCVVHYSGSSRSLRLWTDNGVFLTSALPWGTFGSTISNSVCTLSSTGSFVLSSGNDLTIYLDVTFSGFFPGTHRIGVLARDNLSNESDAALGIWNTGPSNCSYALSSSSQTFSLTGGSGSVGIATGQFCSWVVFSDSSWLTTTSGTSGTGIGTGTIPYTVAPYNGSSSRTGHLTVGSQTLTVQQTGCPYSLSASAQTFSDSGGSGSIAVQTLSVCPWTVTVNVPWIAIVSSTSGTGNGSISFVVTQDLGATRTGTFNVNGSTITVNQSGVGTSGSTFIGSLAQIVSAGGWKMVLNYLNLGVANAQAQMNFTGDDGSPLALPFTFPQNPGAGTVTTSSLASNLPPGAQLIAQTEGAANQAVSAGWGKLSGPSGTAAYGIFISDGNGWQAAVPLETRTSNRYLLAFDNTSPLATGIAIANLSSIAATVPVTIRELPGNTIFFGSLQLNPLAHTSFMLNSTYPVTAGRRGTIEFNPSTGVSISVLGLRANGPSLTTLPVFANTPAGGGSLTHILYNGGWTNSFTLVNTESVPNIVTLRFFDNSGFPLQVPLLIPRTGGTIISTSAVLSLPANGSELIQTMGNATRPVVEGSVQVTTSGQVDGFGIFNWLLANQEASVPLENRNAARYILPFDNTGGLATGLALTEASGQNSNILVIVRDDTGAQLTTSNVTLNPNGHTSFMLPDRFPVATGIRGTVEFDAPSGSRISAIGLRATPAGNVTTIPVLAK